ncbi:hypothetical protein ACFPJ4_05560 [Lysinimonas soli]|uniref:Uncharacterized protein n=1 Tax=Lysinimonas soli TaxID=1074233 RepID=A0ABW0NPJ7_9MICO
MVARWFRISYAENALRRFATDGGHSLETLRATEAVALALAFYRERRAQHTRITDEGDGLLWQWGPDADAERFTIDLTRQLVREDQDAITQLCLTLAYRWTPGRRALGRGHAWCFTPTQIDDFGREIRASAAYRAIATASPVAVTLRTEVL